MSDPQSQAHEVALMLGWTLDLESWHGVYFLAQDGCVTRSIKIPPAELSTLHRVLSEGKRAREALERIVKSGPKPECDYEDACTWGNADDTFAAGREWGMNDAAEIARTALSGGSSYGS